VRVACAAHQGFVDGIRVNHVEKEDFPSNFCKWTNAFRKVSWTMSSASSELGVTKRECKNPSLVTLGETFKTQFISILGGGHEFLVRSGIETRWNEAVTSSFDAAADEELVAAAKNGDELGFESLAKRHPAKDFCTRVSLHTSSGRCGRHCPGNFPESIRPLAEVRRESSFSTWLTVLPSTKP